MEKINYKKKYGQNFLYDQNILDKIINSVNVSEEDLIIEIGPGSGNLTKKLQKFNAQIIAFEIDQTLKIKLDLIENEKTKITYKDILDVDLNDYIKEYSYKKLYIIANIPYYITTPIITKIIESKLDIECMLLMVQEEVADRLSATPGHKEYGYITAYINAFYKVQKLFTVNKTSFFPVPKVDSAIIKLIPNNIFIKDPLKFNQLIKKSFQYKRKTLKNNLKGFDLNLINKILIENNYSLQNRAEEIPLDIYIKISNII